MIPNTLTDSKSLFFRPFLDLTFSYTNRRWHDLHSTQHLTWKLCTHARKFIGILQLWKHLMNSRKRRYRSEEENSGREHATMKVTHFVCIVEKLNFTRNFAYIFLGRFWKIYCFDGNIFRSSFSTNPARLNSIEMLSCSLWFHVQLPPSTANGSLNEIFWN